MLLWGLKWKKFSCNEYSYFVGETDFYWNFHCSIMYLYKAASLHVFIALQEEVLALWAVPEGSI